jgi:hypothetical protein
MALSAALQARAEVLAVQIVVQRILANIAHGTGDFAGTLRKSHQQCLADLENYEIRSGGGAPSREADDIRAQAQAALDRMHTFLRSK